MNPYEEVMQQVKEDWFPFAIAIYMVIAILGFAIAAHADIVSVARNEIGHGEQFGNNRGVYVRQYLNGQENLPWCAGFVSYCAMRSGHKLPYVLRAKSFLKLGTAVNNPRPGDLVVFGRKGGGHVGIVETVTPGNITTIEGNLGDYPSRVKRVVYKGSPKNLLAYVRLIK